MTAQEAETAGKLVSGLVLFGSVACFILGYGLHAFFFCVFAGAGAFCAGFVLWQTNREHTLVRVLFPVTGAAGLYVALFALFYVAGLLGET